MTLVLIKLVSKKESYGKKRRIVGYNDYDVIRPLYIKLLQIIGYAKCFGSNKTISFEAIDKKLVKSYTKIWKKVRSLMNI